MPTHQGMYKPKHPEKYRGDPNGIVYRSMWEKKCFMWADSSPNVKQWSSEEVVIPYYYEIDRSYHRYFVDMWIRFEDGKTLLVEIKPYKETQIPVNPGKKTKRYLEESLTYVKNQNKWKAAEKYAAERGWEFLVWTEHELSAMGILPKQPLKRMKPLRETKGPVKKLKPLKAKKTIKPFGKG